MSNFQLIRSRDWKGKVHQTQICKRTIQGVSRAKEWQGIRDVHVKLSLMSCRRNAVTWQDIVNQYLICMLSIKTSIRLVDKGPLKIKPPWQKDPPTIMKSIHVSCCFLCHISNFVLCTCLGSTVGIWKKFFVFSNMFQDCWYLCISINSYMWYFLFPRTDKLIPSFVLETPV